MDRSKSLDTFSYCYSARGVVEVFICNTMLDAAKAKYNYFFIEVITVASCEANDSNFTCFPNIVLI